MTSKHQKVFDSTTGSYEFIATEYDVLNLQKQIDDGGINPTTVTISANQVVETGEKRFLTETEKSNIESANIEIERLDSNYYELKELLDNTVTSDEKVKMSDSDVSGYLDSKLDNNTIVNQNNMIVAVSLDGLNTSIEDLNMIKGVTGNVQEQLDAIKGLGNFTTSVPTYSDLLNISEPMKDDLVIVIEDENFNNKTTIYIFNGDSWIYTGDFGTGIVRDFIVEPINLNNEIEGLLSKENYEKSSAIDIMYDDNITKLGAYEVQTAIVKLYEELDTIRKSWSNSIGNPLMPSDKLEEQLNKYKDVVTILANNITAKGVNANVNDSLTILADKVLAIPKVDVSVGLSRFNKLNINNSGVIEVTLKEELSESDISSSLLEYINGDEGVVSYEVNFDNKDESDFEHNPDVTFDGFLKLDNKKAIYEMTRDETWTEEGYINYVDITRSDWNRIDKLSISNK